MTKTPASAIKIAPSTALSLFRKVPMRKGYLLLMVVTVLILCGTASAQVAPLPFAPSQFFDNNGHPLAGGRLFTYAAGTSTNLATYSDALGTVLNADPVILDAGGRARVFMGSNAYKFVLQNSLGQQIWSIDNMTANNLSLLASNNIWTGTNQWNNTSTFNGPVTMNVGFTSSGPNTLNGGGTLAGTWSGNPTFSGTLNFAGGFTATTGTFSGQIISTLATGTSPFVIASTTQIPNLNASLLQGQDWANPGAIGFTTPSTIDGTTINAHTSFTIAGGTTQTGIQGTDTHLQTAGTVSGPAGTSVCIDSAGGITTSGCIPVHQLFTAQTSSVCTTGASSYDVCDNTIPWSGTFTASNYIATCTGFSPSDGRAAVQGITSQNTTSVSVRIVTNGSVAVTYTIISCIGVL